MNHDKFLFLSDKPSRLEIDSRTNWWHIQLQWFVQSVTCEGFIADEPQWGRQAVFLCDLTHTHTHTHKMATNIAGPGQAGRVTDRRSVADGRRRLIRRRYRPRRLVVVVVRSISSGASRTLLCPPAREGSGRAPALSPPSPPLSSSDSATINIWCSGRQTDSSRLLQAAGRGCYCCLVERQYAAGWLGNQYPQGCLIALQPLSTTNRLHGSFKLHACHRHRNKSAPPPHAVTHSPVSITI